MADVLFLATCRIQKQFFNKENIEILKQIKLQGELHQKINYFAGQGVSKCYAIFFYIKPQI